MSKVRHISGDDCVQRRSNGGRDQDVILEVRTRQRVGIDQRLPPDSDDIECRNIPPDCGPAALVPMAFRPM
ncbi:MAG: hypothetical protein FJ303_06150 [Planctomycetes bacterium]|nr:hypothetical protein [Planctomycetota bacterium]